MKNYCVGFTFCKFEGGIIRREYTITAVDKRNAIEQCSNLFFAEFTHIDGHLTIDFVR